MPKLPRWLNSAWKYRSVDKGAIHVFGCRNRRNWNYAFQDMHMSSEWKKSEQTKPVAFVPEPSVDSDTLYQVIGFRRQTSDTLVWQAPILSMTAQAFLMLISLGSDSTIAARAIASLFSFTVSLASIHTMAKSRQFEHEDSMWCGEYERRRWGANEADRPAPHYRRGIISSKGCFIKFPSFYVWVFILLLFAAVSLTIFIMASVPCFRATLDSYLRR
jgi:hypothetical protein